MAKTRLPPQRHGGTEVAQRRRTTSVLPPCSLCLCGESVPSIVQPFLFSHYPKIKVQSLTVHPAPPQRSSARCLPVRRRVQPIPRLSNPPGRGNFSQSSRLRFPVYLSNILPER